LAALRQSNGTAIAVSDQEMLDYAQVMGKHTGIFPAPEGAACLAAQVRLIEQGWIKADDEVVLFNTGSGLKYAHLWANESATVAQ
jgi:threonine synthase